MGKGLFHQSGKGEGGSYAPLNKVELASNKTLNLHRASYGLDNSKSFNNVISK